jgi:Resolvase, N terminal domain
MSKITTDHLVRSAYVYIRQSTPDQLTHNHESRRRQYDLADRARQLGWTTVEVIDDDLGRSGGGTARPGFERVSMLSVLHPIPRRPILLRSRRRFRAWRRNIRRAASHRESVFPEHEAVACKLQLGAQWSTSWGSERPISGLSCPLMQ